MNGRLIGFLLLAAIGGWWLAAGDPGTASEAISTAADQPAQQRPATPSRQAAWPVTPATTADTENPKDRAQPRPDQTAAVQVDAEWLAAFSSAVMLPEEEAQTGPAHARHNQGVEPGSAQGDSNPTRSNARALQAVSGWLFSNGGASEYSIESVAAADGHAVRLASSAERSGPPSSFAYLGQRLDIRPYRGRQVEITARLRASEVTGSAEPWARIDSEGGARQLHNNWSQRSEPRGTHEWRTETTVLDIPQTAVQLSVGGFLAGPGSVEFDYLAVRPLGAMPDSNLLDNPELEPAPGD